METQIYVTEQYETKLYCYPVKCQIKNIQKENDEHIDSSLQLLNVEMIGLILNTYKLTYLKQQ